MSKRSKFTGEQRSSAIARYKAGEPVTSIAKSIGLSKPGFYLWLKEDDQGARPATMERLALLESRVAALEMLI